MRIHRRRQIIIGTRGSRLALWQSGFVRDLLKDKFRKLDVELKVIKTKGDKILDAPLSKIGRKGVFTREIENELLSGDIDIAVHSMKDLPTELPEGLSVGAIPKRDDVRDVLVSRDRVGLRQLAGGSKIGTSSLRRRAQLANLRNDLDFADIRGNIDTRLKKLDYGDYDALILASAGLERMGWKDKITEYISPQICLPAPGQGALGVEIRQDDRRVLEFVSVLGNEDTRLVVEAEREFLRGLGGGCQVPIGAWGRIEDDSLCLEGVVALLDGSKLLREKVVEGKSDAGGTGKKLADILIEKGADRILESVLTEAERPPQNASETV